MPFIAAWSGDVSSGDIPSVFSAGWIYNITRIWKISGWQIGDLVRVQAGDAVRMSQVTNFNSAFGFALQRPNRHQQPQCDRAAFRHRVVQHRRIYDCASVHAW